MKADVEDAVAPPKKPEEHDSASERIKREIISWVWVILAFLFIEGTLVQARVIPSGSMENTVLIGDHLIVSRIGYDAGIPFTSMPRAADGAIRSGSRSLYFARRCPRKAIQISSNGASACPATASRLLPDRFM